MAVLTEARILHLGRMLVTVVAGAGMVAMVQVIEYDQPWSIGDSHLLVLFFIIGSTLSFL